MDNLYDLLDMLPDGVAITDETGCIRLVNKQTEVLFGWESKKLLGQPVETLLPERFRTVHVSRRSGYAAKPYMRPMGIGLELFGLRQDGTEFPVEISLSPITIDGTQLVLATIRDVTAQRLLEQQARAELAGRLSLLQVVLDELPVGVYLAKGWDAELVLANLRISDIWGAEWPAGQPMAEFVANSGAQVYDVQGGQIPTEHLATLRALRSGQSVWQHQAVIRRHDGSTLSILANAVALDPHIFPLLSDVARRPEAPIPVVLVVHEDVTALAEAERLKDEFVAMAAHELRNPVAVLLGSAHLLRQATGPRPDPVSPTSESPENGGIPWEWQEEASTAVVEAGERLAALTDDLLDATRLQANRLELRPEPLDMGALVRRVVKRQHLATDRHTIEMTLPAETDPLLVEADMQRLEQVLTNLLSNAIKYSPDGGSIEVEVSRSVHPKFTADTGAEARSEWARVAVSDHGMGIPADQFDRIFARFGRASNARERAIPGTGLGLYLCRELIERHGGRVWFESREGNGTTFTFELPCWTPSA
jgi:PAS domain S-box-containing protein